MVWYVLSGGKTSEAATEFSRSNHATAVHAQKVILDVLQGFGDPAIRSILNTLISYAQGFPEPTTEPHVNELISLVMLENRKTPSN
jgi:hypothetical protein